MTDRPKNTGFPIASNREALAECTIDGEVVEMFPTNPIASNREVIDIMTKLADDPRFSTNPIASNREASGWNRLCWVQPARRVSN
jgi:hypothetical protein